MLFRNGALTRRDAFLLLLGASSMHIWSLLFSSQTPSDQSIITIADDTQNLPFNEVTTKTVQHTRTKLKTEIQTITATATITSIATATAAPTSPAISPYDDLPPTEVLAHTPGWTLFRNLYMSNGTMFIVADEKQRSKLPEIRLMASTPLEAINSPENIAAREPTKWIMDVITPEQAEARWRETKGKHIGLNRVWTVEGNTVLVYEPKQFLRHYYHLVAELFFGVQAFWHGAFSPPILPSGSSTSSSAHFALNYTSMPPIDRTIFAFSDADGWRDNPGFNRYFLRGALPSLTIEHSEDWNDRIEATRSAPGQIEGGRAYHFPLLLLTDRSAAHRGPVCGSQTQRIAAEAWDYMRVRGKLPGLHVGGWWQPLREAMWRFAGAEAGTRSLSSQTDAAQTVLRVPPSTEVIGTDAPEDKSQIVDVDSANQKELPLPEKIVISYISRQTAQNRKLIKEDHDGMVLALQELVERKNKERKQIMDTIDRVTEEDDDERRRRDIGVELENRVMLEWEFNELIAEHMTRDDQIRAAARTTFMLGVHGNGLTHLVFMEPTRISTVIEIFYPKGFAHDYQWTTRALGMTHFAVWNDTHHTYPDKPQVDYPDGFQKNSIPVHGPTIAQLIEDRVAGKL